MDYLTCPNCQDAHLLQTEHGRTCPYCNHTLSEMDYQIYAAQQMEKLAQEQDALERKKVRGVRATFGNEPRVKKA